MQSILKYKKYMLLVFVIIILGVFGYLYYVEINNNNDNTDIIKEEANSYEITTTSEDSFYVDVKGAVKKPGVYEFTSNDKIIDAINKAGGLKANAVTSNINLSLKLQSEMVVYIFNKSELKGTTTSVFSNTCKCQTIEVNNCINPTTFNQKTSNVITTKNESISTSEPTTSTIQDSKININTASLEELTTLSGIGESKAKAIIEYRSNNYFNSIEDIMNVSGLGNSIFEKIKDYITV